MNSPVPANATRTLFPIQGGRLQFDLVNRTGGPINEYLDVIMYIAYLDYTFCYTPSCPGCSCQDGYSRPPSWTNFRTGTDCSLRLNITDNLRDGDGNTFGATLVGLNVTFVLMFKDIRDHGLFEEVDEVCSIPLTSLLGLHWVETDCSSVRMAHWCLEISSLGRTVVPAIGISCLILLYLQAFRRQPKFPTLPRRMIESMLICRSQLLRDLCYFSFSPRHVLFEFNCLEVPWWNI